MSTSWDLVNTAICSFCWSISILTNAPITWSYIILSSGLWNSACTWNRRTRKVGTSMQRLGLGKVMSALNLQCLTLNPRKHTCRYGKVVLECTHEAQLYTTKLKKRWWVSNSVTLLLCYTNNTTPHGPHTSIPKMICSNMICWALL